MVEVQINGETKEIEGDQMKLARTIFNKPYGTKYTEEEMFEMGFERK